MLVLGQTDGLYVLCAIVYVERHHHNGSILLFTLLRLERAALPSRVIMGESLFFFLAACTALL